MLKCTLKSPWIGHHAISKLLALFVFVIAAMPTSLLMAAGCDDYHAVPPFLSAKLPPNVMIMLDNSGSMKNRIITSSFNPGTAYYGLFESNTNYRYDSTVPVDTTPYSGTPYNVTVDTTATGAFIEDAACTLGSGNNCWSGNFLNWLTTRRIDAARKVLVGGKVESRNGYDYLGSDSILEWKIVGNNERSDHSFSKTYSLSQNYSPAPANSTFTIESPAEDGTTMTSYDPYAKISTSTATLFENKAGDIIGETGTIGAISADAKDAGTWDTITLKKTDYTNPVVIARPLSYNGGDPSVVRVSDVQSGSFKIRVEEWEHDDGGHTDEAVSYMVVEAGAHILPNDQILLASTVDVDSNWETVTPLGLSAVPVVLTTVTTNSDGDTVTTRIKDVTAGSFDVRLQEEENLGTHPDETVAYIVLQQGTYDVGSLTFEVDVKTNVDDSQWTTINFSGASKRIFLADMQTTNGADTASLRYQSLESTSVQIFVEEETSADSETGHADEDVGYVAINNPNIYNIALIVDEEPTGLIQEIVNDVRLGVSFYRYQKDSDIYNGEWAHGGTLSLDIPYNPFIKNPSTFRTVNTPIKAQMADIIDAIEHYPLVWGTTPLAENYYEILNYFQQAPPFYEDKPTIGTTYNYKVYDPNYDPLTSPSYADPSHFWDPYYYEEYSSTIRCAKSFILLFTDGAPYRDDYVPYFFNKDGKLLTPNTVDYDQDSHGGDCSSTADTANSCKDTLDDIAYWAYWDKIAAPDNDASGNQNLHPVTGELMWIPDFRDLRADLDGNQYIETYTVAFGRSTIPAILQDTADHGNGTAYAAEDGHQLEASLSEAFSSILKKTSAGSAISVLTERATSGSVIHQALFFPEKTFVDGSNTYTLGWSGALNAYWFFNNGMVTNIREDNAIAPDGEPYYLDIHDDSSLVFRVDAEGSLKIDHYSLIDSSGIDDGASDVIIGTYDDVDEITKIWEGGSLLKDRSVEATPSVPASNGGRTVYGINESGTMSEFIAADYTDFDDQLGLTLADYPECLGTVSATPTAGELQQRAENLIGYTRGASDDFTGTNGSACRNRVVDDAGNIWKLGDIIYSTPQVVEYTDNSLLITGANDGMLHAFNIGYVSKDGLSNEQIVRLCDSKTGNCTQIEIGQEIWSFIPQNAMPYLKYLADPDYKHMYSIDLAPYHISNGGKEIVVVGMRLGGATGATDKQNNWLGDTNGDGDINEDSDGIALQVVPPGCSSASPDLCLGYSSYFALDVTDKDNPVFLWEYSHPRLGFTYSGPAFLTRGNKRYIMFTSGPVNYRAAADDKDLKMFIVEVDSDFKMIDTNSDASIDNDDVYKIDGNNDAGFAATPVFSSFNNSFGGRLFTNGIDYNRDGDTELVLFGVNTGSASSGWVGDVVAVAPNDDPPVDSKGKINWEIVKVYNDPHAAITTKVEFSRCFNDAFIYFGSGRWFYKDDSPGSIAHPLTGLYGVQITACLNDLIAGGTCSGGFNQVAATKVGDQLCGTLAGDLASSKVNWVISDGELLPQGGGYLRERTITDPNANVRNVVFFTTTQPSSDICAFGGRTRVWGINCLTGHGMFDGCTSDTTPVVPKGSLLLQLSGGNIEEADLDQSTFNQVGGKATPFMIGIPPESFPPVVLHSSLVGEIILWIER